MKQIKLFLILAVFLLALPLFSLSVNAGAIKWNLSFSDDTGLRSGYTCGLANGILNCTNGQIAYLTNDTINISSNTDSHTIEMVFEAVSGTANQFGMGWKAGNASTSCGNDGEGLGIRNEGGTAKLYHGAAPEQISLFTIGDGLKHNLKVSTL